MVGTAFVNGLVVPVQDEAEPYTGHVLVGANGRIIGTGPGAPAIPAERVVDLGGRIVLPGFVSAHGHLWQSAFRGIADGHGLLAWIEHLRKRCGSDMSETAMYDATLHGGADLLRHGVTTVCNHSQKLGEGADGQWRAIFDLPQRTVYVYSSTRTAQAHERLADIRRFHTMAAGTNDPRLLGCAVNTTGTLPLSDMRRESELLRELGYAQHAHYLEAPTDAAQRRAEFPLLVDGGRVGPDTVFAHFIHTSDDITATAAQLGAAMVWNPLSNGRLGSGIPDIISYRRYGMRVGLGLDGQASADVSDPFQNMRTGLYLLRAATQDPSVMTAREILRAHTLGAAEVLGVDERVGSLEPGKHADLIVLDPDRPSAGPIAPDVYAYIVLALSATNISAIYVGGEHVSGGPLATQAEELRPENA